MKIRVKIIFLIIVVVSITLISSLYTVTSKYYSQTLDRIYENHTYHALNVSEQIKAYIGKIRLNIGTVDQKILNTSYPEVIHILSIKDSNVKHIYQKKEELNLSYYSQALQNSFKPIFVIGEFFCFSFFVDDVNYIYFVKSKHIRNMGLQSQAVGIGILDIKDLTVLNLGSDEFDFIAPTPEIINDVNNSKSVFSKILELKTGKKLLMAFAGLDEEKQSYVLVQAKQAQITDLVYSHLKDIFILILSLVFVFIVIAIKLTKNITAPIEALTKATKKISKGEWELSHLAKSNDEVGELTEAFKSMGNELEDRENKIKTIHEKLLQSEKLASLGLFSAGVAHEVKNPLGAILGNAQLIKRKIEDEDLLRYTSTIIDESYRANNIVQDLLVFAKERPLNKESILLEHFKTDLERILTPQCQENNIILTIETSGKSSIFDRDQILQVIENMALNAIDALVESEKDNLKLEIVLGSEENSAKIIIRDNGIGMDKDTQLKIFEPFYSTKKIKKGTGLGMAICYGIINKHEGSIEINSQLNEGTEFIIKV